MAAITTKRRNALPASKFALPKDRAYPVDTRGRAANAKARAKQALDKGHLSPAQYHHVVAKANMKLYGKRGNTG